jgi:hypothetical protein
MKALVKWIMLLAIDIVVSAYQWLDVKCTKYLGATK